MKVFILGANGFIGSHLSEAILAKTDWTFPLRFSSDKIESSLKISLQLLKRTSPVKKMGERTNRRLRCGAALGGHRYTATYVQDPLRIFELDFEANLEIIRHCVALKKRIISLPLPKSMACARTRPLMKRPAIGDWPHQQGTLDLFFFQQLLDRVIYAYGKHMTCNTLFRPFNWYGPAWTMCSIPSPAARAL